MALISGFWVKILISGKTMQAESGSRPETLSNPVAWSERKQTPFAGFSCVSEETFAELEGMVLISIYFLHIQQSN
jgi:hypothetical protein